MENSQSKVVVTKWSLVLVALAAGAYYILPMVLRMALTAVSIVLIGLFLLAVFMLLPAIAEWLSLWGWRLYALAIKTDPISRLRKDLDAHDKQIKALEDRIADADTEIAGLDDLQRQHARALTPEDKTNWAAQVKQLQQARNELQNIHDEEIMRHQEFSLLVQRAEAQYQIGSAFGKAASVIRGKREGPGSLGTKIAFEEVRRQLGESQAKLALVLRRSTIERGELPAPDTKSLPEPAVELLPAEEQKERKGTRR